MPWLGSLRPVKIIVHHAVAHSRAAITHSEPRFKHLVAAEVSTIKSASLKSLGEAGGEAGVPLQQVESSSVSRLSGD